MGAGQRFLTKAEGAKDCGVSEATIQRWRRDGAFPGAVFGDKGTLLIPEAELARRAKPSTERPARLAAPIEPVELETGLEAELRELRAALAAERARAERLADEVA